METIGRVVPDPASKLYPGSGGALGRTEGTNGTPGQQVFIQKLICLLVNQLRRLLQAIAQQGVGSSFRTGV